MNLWELEKLGHAWTAAEAANYRFEFGGYKKTLGKCYHWPKKVTVGKTYAQDNEHMRKMESEAYLEGNLLLRDHEDQFKRE